MHRRVIPLALPGNTVPKETFADAPGGASLRFIFSFVPRAPSAPLGHLPRNGEVYIGRFQNRPTAIIHYSSAKRLHYSIFIRPPVSSRLPFPAIPCRWQRLRAFTERPYLPNALLFDTVPKAAFAKSPPCLKGGVGGDSACIPATLCQWQRFPDTPGGASLRANR